MPFAGTVHKFKFGQVIEVLKIIIFFSLRFPELRVILASSKHPQRFDVSAFMLHPDHPREWQCLGLVQAKPLCHSTKGTQWNRHRIATASVGSWNGGREQGRKNKSLG